MSQRQMGHDPGARARGGALLLAAVGALAPGLAAAAETPVGSQVETAELALKNLDYDAANRAAAAIVNEHGLTHDQLVVAYRILAITSAVLGRDTAAREAFQELLTFDPTYPGDPNLGPKVDSPFMEAQGFMHSLPALPGVETSVTLHPKEPGAIHVVTRDPTHVAKRVTVGFRWGAEAPFALGELPASGGDIAIPPPPIGTTRLDYYVQARDERDDAIFESGTPATPKSATLDLSPPRPAVAASEERHRPLFASPIFWTITGVVVAGAATGIYFAAKKPGDPTSVTLAPTFRCGSTPGSC